MSEPNQGIIRGQSPLIELMSARRADINSYIQGFNAEVHLIYSFNTVVIIFEQ